MHARRLASEFVVIVLGVLVALAVDSWREVREERALAAQYLDVLAAEVRADSAQLDRISRALNRQRAAVRVLLAADFGWVAAQGIDSLLTLHRSLIYLVDLPAGGPTYEDLLATGNLRLIKDMALRRAIVGYHSYRARVTQQLRDGREGLGVLTVTPAYAAVLPPQLFAVGTDSVSTIPDSVLTSVRVEPLLPTNPEVRRYVHAATIYHAMVELVVVGNLRDRSQDLLALLPASRAR